MKYFLLLMSLVAFTAVAHADDSAFPRIEVKGINPGPLSADQKITFYGEKASDFFKMLPAIQSVDPAQDKIEAQHFRTLSVMSQNWAIEMSCSNATYSSSGEWKPNSKGTQCDIQIRKASEYEGDSYDYTPKDVVTGEVPPALRK